MIAMVRYFKEYHGITTVKKKVQANIHLTECLTTFSFLNFKTDITFSLCVAACVPTTANITFT